MGKIITYGEAKTKLGSSASVTTNKCPTKNGLVLTFGTAVNYSKLSSYAINQCVQNVDVVKSSKILYQFIPGSANTGWSKGIGAGWKLVGNYYEYTADNYSAPNDDIQLYLGYPNNLTLEKHGAAVIVELYAGNSLSQVVDPIGILSLQDVDDVTCANINLRGGQGTVTWYGEKLIWDYDHNIVDTTMYDDIGDITTSVYNKNTYAILWNNNGTIKSFTCEKSGSTSTPDEVIARVLKSDIEDYCGDIQLPDDIRTNGTRLDSINIGKPWANMEDDYSQFPDEWTNIEQTALRFYGCYYAEIY